MENIIIILSFVGFCRAFYHAIGEPSSNMDENAILYKYTDFVSKVIAKIHRVEIPDDGTSAYFAVFPYIEKYYKFLGFCYICFSFWTGLIFCFMYFETYADKITYLGLLLTINFIIRKWTI